MPVPYEQAGVMKHENNGSTSQQRLARASEAKQKALYKLRSKPPADAAVIAKRQSSRLKREAAQGQKSAVRAVMWKEAKDARPTAAA